MATFLASSVSSFIPVLWSLCPVEVAGVMKVCARAGSWHVIQELWRIGLLSSVQLAKEVKVLRVDLWWGKAVGIIVNVNGAE